jgi:Zn-dependent membrane protease YugP
MLKNNPNKIYIISFDPRLQRRIDDLKLKLHPSSKQILLESNQLGFTSFEITSLILQERKRTDIKVCITKAEINCYSPIHNWIGLSESIASSQSVMAVAIAAHEISHALQPRFEQKINNFLNREDIEWFSSLHYDFIILRGMVEVMLDFKKIPGIEVSISFPDPNYPILKIIALMPLFICYEIFNSTVVFVEEVDASMRAMRLLKYYKILDRKQLKVARKFLVACGLTYISK